jgi:DNA gyrase subunit B
VEAILTEDGHVEFLRHWRGVTDYHKIEAAFLISAEARKLARLAAEQAEVYRAPAKFSRSTAVAEPEPVAEETEGDDAPPPRARSIWMARSRALAIARSGAGHRAQGPLDPAL